MQGGGGRGRKVEGMKGEVEGRGWGHETGKEGVLEEWRAMGRREGEVTFSFVF